MKNIVRFSLFLVCLAAFLAVTMTPETSAQRREKFSHATAAHKKKDCNSCHTLPTANSFATRGIPDVADFPGHAACFACHRSEFFSGNRPAICAGCHVNPGPRGVARLPFPVKTRTQEFTSIFPHNVHQDVIAEAAPRRSEVAVAHFIKANFVKRDDPPKFNNCAICHETSKAVPKYAPRIPASMQPLGDAAADSFTPTAQFFKDMPSGHQSCFQCHYQGVKPVATDCAGCHKLTAPYMDSPVVRRFSIKFDHNQKEHSVRDCMTCHVRISQNADLKSLVDADVPFMACVSCHNDKITEETKKRTDTLGAQQPAFQCTYCHAPAVGRFPIPKSHENP